MEHITKALKRMKDNNWDFMYLAIDVHGTMIKPTHHNDNKFEFYNDAEKALQYISTREDIVMIMYTSSYPEYIDKLMGFLVDHDIYFDYVNENLNVESDHVCDFSDKFYYDALLDDKAGFNPDTDWTKLMNTLQSNNNE